jgi:hypothetical protein
MHRIADDLRAALLTAFEAAHQAARGQYNPEPDLAPALALLLDRGTGDRPLYVAFRHACAGPRQMDVNPTTTNHLRGNEAKALWRRIAVDVGVEVTPDAQARFYADARKPDQRHCQALFVPKWL